MCFRCVSNAISKCTLSRDAFDVFIKKIKAFKSKFSPLLQALDEVQEYTSDKGTINL